jgi:threonyl-tRNA synthetase
VVGDREAESGAVSVRAHRGGDAGSEPVATFAHRVMDESKTRSP